jgi:glycosyltransferase involved in cell wall biosynthesis
MPLLEPKPMPDGRIDVPGPGAVLERGPITIVGWALFPSGPCVRIDVSLGGRRLERARIGLPRVDLSRQTGDPAAGLAGFELITDISEWPGADGEAELEVVAIGPRGERNELRTAVEIAPKEETVEEVGALQAAPPHRPADGGPPRVLIFTHQLTLGGAQLYLLELLRELVANDAIDATVVSTLDGPLRGELAEFGIPSHVTSMVAIEGGSAHRGRVEELAAWASDGGFELAFVNTATATAFPGVDIATRLGIPSIWVIHESQEPPVLWRGLHPELRASAERDLGDAAVVLFVAESTQRLFEPWRKENRFLTIPYGLDLEPIESAREGFDRSSARSEAGIPDDAELVICVGSVEPRKAQVSLTEAFERIAAANPSAHLALVGAKDDDDAMLLGDYIAASPFRDRIRLIPLTPEVQVWYGMADLLVCASDVESLPRSVVEGMAWELPVLATDVYGLPELVREGETGWLCPARDVEALAAGLERALSSSAEERARMGRAGRALVERRHSLSEYGRRIGELIGEVSRSARAGAGTP